jgi:hypothetical protein
MPRRSALQPGNVFEIALPSGGFAYGMIVDPPLAVFFDATFTQRPPLADVLHAPVAFRIWVMNSCFSKGRWPLVGSVPVPEPLQKPPTFYKFDPIARRFSLYESGQETPATRDQCLALECAAVWSPEHVESRLDDHFGGRPNQWVESLSASHVNA